MFHSIIYRYFSIVLLLTLLPNKMAIKTLLYRPDQYLNLMNEMNNEMKIIGGRYRYIYCLVIEKMFDYSKIYRPTGEKYILLPIIAHFG